MGYLPLQGQVTQVEAKMDTSRIMIGDQAYLTLSLDVPVRSEVYWPFFTSDTVVSGVEILRQEDVDTLMLTGDYIRYFQKLLITVFDSGSYEIPPVPFEFRLKGDTSVFRLSTLPLYLDVIAPDVDLNAEIKPIKPPLEAPFSLAEILPHLLIGIGVLAIAALAWWFVVKRRKAVPSVAPRRKPSVPAHVQALQELEELKRKKLWQSGKVKEYYTAITDVVRWYIEERYKVPALEMTTEEIMAGLNRTDTGKQPLDRLYGTLTLADLVKFAKEQPLPVDNDKSLDDCIYFVNETKPVPLTREINQENEKEKISA